MAGSWSDAQEKLQSIAADMRSVVVNCCGQSAGNLTDVVFVTAMGAHPQYQRLRRELKGLLKRLCTSIFQGDARLLKMLRFPQEYRNLQKDVDKLSLLRPGLPILELESVSGSEYGLLAGSHSNAQSLQALQVLHDVGSVIFCSVSDGCGGSKACLCWKPQVVANVIAKFADPGHSLPIQRGCASRAVLETILKQCLQDELPAQSDTERLRDASTLFNFLLALRVIAPIERAVAADGSLLPASDGSVQFMVPSALKGRPSFWREVFGLDHACCFSCVRGVRFACMDAMITVAAFVRAMTQLCFDPTRMWGCAFSFQLLNHGCMFVRLAESRDFVDVVVLGSDMSQLVGEHVDEGFRQVTALLRCSTSSPLLLCPHCCASDMFARSGAVHAFYREQIEFMATCNTQQQQQQQPVDDMPLRSTSSGSGSGSEANTITNQRGSADLSREDGAVFNDLNSAPRAGNPPGSRGDALSVQPAPAAAVLNCSRYHEVTKDSLLNGLCVGVIGSRDMPALYPHCASPRDGLPWTRVSPLGLIEFGDKFKVVPNSFFELTQQLKDGELLSQACMRSINDAIRSKATVCHLEPPLQREGDGPPLAQLKLRFAVGSEHGSGDSKKVVAAILSCRGASEIDSLDGSAVTTKCGHGMECGARVMLSSGGVICRVSAVMSETKIVLVPDTASAPALQLEAGATIFPMLDSFSFEDHVLVLYYPLQVSVVPKQRQAFALFPGVTAEVHTLRLEPSDCSRSSEATCWREVEDNWAIMLGSEFRNYEITSMTLFRCEDRERLFLAEVSRLTSIAPQRPQPDFSSPIDVGDAQKAEREALQKQVMGHFSDFSQKFSLLPSSESTDVNLSVAWWGKWPAIYHGAAQNGFWNLPTHLKIDPGYFGEGFYLTRYPRYSDYYINGFSLSKRKVDNGSILMCYAALGRPYPVTQDPFPPPLYTRGPPSPSSPCGKVCGAACGFSSSSGIDSHDSHYVTVKMHPKAGQYFPCPLRQQPDFDEIVVFNPDRILPVAYVTFQRRCCRRCCARNDALARG